MSRITQRRLRGLIAAVATLCATAIVVWLAVQADGRPLTDASSNDGGAWLANRRTGEVLNVEHSSTEVRDTVAPFDPGSTMVVRQSDTVTLAYDAGTGVVKFLDTTVSQVNSTTVVPTGATVTASDNTIVVFHRPRLWVTSAADFKGAENLVEDELEVQSASEVAVQVSGGPVVLSADGIVSRPLSSAGEVQLTDITEPRHMALARDLAAFEREGTWEIASLSGATTIRAGAPPAVFVQQSGRHRDWLAFTAGDTTEQLYLLNTESGRVVRILGDVDGITHDLLFHDSCVHRLARVAGGELTQSNICVDLTLLPTNGEDSTVTPTSSDEQQSGVEEAELRLVNGFVWIDTFDGEGWVFDDLAYAKIEPVTTPVPEITAEPDPDDIEDEVGGDDNADATKECEDTDPEVQERPVAVADTSSGTGDSPLTQFATRLGRPVVIDVLRNDYDPDCDVMFIVNATLTGGEGSIQISPNRDSIQVVPGPLTGRIELTYEISDGTSRATSPAAAVVVVKAVERSGNLAPVTRPDRLVSSAGSVVRVNVLQNDVDPDGDSLRLVDAGNPGAPEADPTLPQVLASHPNGDLVIALPTGLADDNAEVDLAYEVADEWGDTSTGEVLLRVRLAASNYQPNARNDRATIREDQQVVFNLLENDVDGDGDTLQIARNADQIAGPSGANFSTTSAGEFTFAAPDPGTYLFEYAVTDGNLSDTAKIRVDVSAAEDNAVPVAFRDDVVLAVGETRLIRVFANDGDPDGDVVGVATIQPNPNVSVEIIDGFGFLVTLRPSAGRLETFSYTITDGRRDPETGTILTSAPALVAVTRSDAPFQNGPPIAVDDSVRVRPGRVSFVRVLDNDFDPEGHRIMLAAEDGIGLAVQGADGATDGIRASGTADGQLVQLEVPATTELPFAFGYSIEDDADSEPASATVRVSLVGEGEENTPPVARIDREIVRPGATVEISVLSNDSDRESDALSLTGALRQLPSHGTAEVREEDGIIVYTAARDFGGTDRFTYAVRDSEGGESVGLIEVGVLPKSRENNPPVAAPDLDFELYAGSGEQFLDVLANDSDFDGDPLSVIDVSTYAFDQDDVEATSATQIPEAGNGVLLLMPEQVDEPIEVPLRYEISDGRGGTAEAEILVLVNPDANNVGPIAEPDIIGPVRAGEIVTVDVLANDIDPDNAPNSTELGLRLDLALIADQAGTRVEGPQDGPQLLEITAPAQTSEIGYSVEDNDGLVASSFVTVLVQPNLPPVVQEPIILPEGPEAELAADTTLSINLADYVTDPDGDALTFFNVGAQVGGTTTLGEIEGDGIVNFTASPDFAGQGGFSFSVRDDAHEVTGTVIIRLSGPPNRPPLPQDVALSVEAGVSQPLDLNSLFEDPDEDQLTFTISQLPNDVLQLLGVDAAGATESTTITLAVDRRQAAVATVPFTITASDGELSADAVVSVQLLDAAVDPPTAQSDEWRTTQGVAITDDPRVNDVDPFTEGLSIVSAVALSGGAASHDSEQVTFTPATDFFGTATIQYEIRDTRESDLGRAQGVITVKVIGRPSVAQQVEAEATGPRSVNLTWRAPDNNGAPIEFYTIRVRTGGGAAEDIEYVGENPQFVFNDLESGAEYDFQVAAHNEAGTAEFSQWSNVVVPDQVPAAPARPDVSFQDVDPGQIRISWNEPLNPGSDIQRYIVRATGACLPNGDIAETERGAADLEFIWAGLTNGERCAFTVEAHNLAVTERGEDALASPPSDSICPVAVPGTSGAPTAARGDEQAVVNWVAPENPDCETLIGYELQRVRNGAPDGAPLSVPSGTLTDTSAPLANGDDYQFQVRAQNRRGWGEWGPLSSPVVPCRQPDAPPAPTAVRDDQAATITRVGDAFSNGCAVSQYQVRLAPDGGALAFTSTSQLYSGLVNGTTYQFQLRAINEIGNGPWSPPSNGVVPAGQPFPGVVTLVDAPTPGQLEWAIAFQDPNNGAAMTGTTLSGNVVGFVSAGATGRGQCVNAQNLPCLSGSETTVAPGIDCMQNTQDVTATGQGTTDAGQSGPASLAVTLEGCADAPFLAVDFADDGQYTLSWSNPVGTDTLYLQRNGEPPAQWEEQTAGSTGNTFTTPSNNENFDVTIWACNAYGCTASSTETVLIPARVEYLPGWDAGGFVRMTCHESREAARANTAAIVANLRGFIAGEYVSGSWGIEHADDPGFLSRAADSDGVIRIRWECADDPDDILNPYRWETIVFTGETSGRSVTVEIEMLAP